MIEAPTPTHPRDDRQLLLQWRAGVRASGAELLGRYFRPLQLFFSTKVARSEQVDDLMQRTFLRCAECCERWQEERGSFRVFLLGIARNVLLHHFRWQRRHDRRFEALESSVEDLNQGPFEAVVERHEHQALVGALQQIPVDLQITLELLYWHGLTSAETAQVLGVAEATVRTRVLRAKRRLREVMRRREAVSVREP